MNTSPSVQEYAFQDCHKLVLSLKDGLTIETAFHPPEWLCLSTQAGCPLACAFCETGASGFRRNLKFDEIILQFNEATSRIDKRVGYSESFETIWFSGMGEPLLNFPVLKESLICLNQQTNAVLRVTTLGILPRLAALFSLDVPFHLDVSLHASSDRKRNQLIPINLHFPIRDVLDEIFTLNRRRGAFITLSYLMLDGVNDSDEDLDNLIQILDDYPACLELKRFNPTSSGTLQSSSEERFQMFLREVTQHGHFAYIFGSEGTEIGAGCGQLVWGGATRENLTG